MTKISTSISSPIRAQCTSTINEDMVQINIFNSGPNFKIQLYLSSYFLFGIPFLKSHQNVCTVQFRFSEIKSSDNLRFSDYFQKTITYFTT